MLKRTFVVLAKLLLFVAVVWLVVMAYWKYTDHVVSSEDLLIYFLILPVVLLLAFVLFRILWWATKKTYRRFWAPAGVQAATAASAPAGASTDSSAEIHPPTYVIATAMSTYFGDEGTLFLDAILQDKRRAEINEEITQELGYGVRVAGVDQLETAPLHEGARTTMLHTRALLEKIYEQLEGVLRQAAPSAESVDGNDKKHWGVQLHPEWRGELKQQNAVHEASVPEAPLGSMPTRLSVHIVLPLFLTSPEISLIQTEVMEWLQTLDWPKQAVTLLTIQPENDVEYLRRIQTWQQQSSSDTSAKEWLLVLSAVSWLDMDLLNDKLHKDVRFADRLARGGAVIGELACGLVLAKTRPDSRLQLEPLARLSFLTLAQRNKPVDAKGTIEAELLTEMLVDQTSALNEEEKNFVGLTVSGDLNNGRAVELGRWVTDGLPQLDFIDDVLCVSEHIGECEPCGSLLALMLAAAMAQQREGTVLYCANQHASWRGLAVVKPALQT